MRAVGVRRRAGPAPGTAGDDEAVRPAVLRRLRRRPAARGRPGLTGRVAQVDDDTPALRALRGADLAYEVVRTERARSAEESASFQGIELGQLLRTIVVRRGADDYVFVLVPGGRQIDWPRLRAHLGVSRLALPDAEEAKTATGYERGTITPFGASKSWPVIADTRIPSLERVAIGGGGHGVNLQVAGRALVTALGAEVADVTRDGSGQPQTHVPSPRTHVDRTNPPERLH